MHIVYGFVVAMGLSMLANAAPIDYKPLGVDLRPGDTLVVRGIDGEIKLVPTTDKGSMTVRVRQINPAQWPSNLKSSLDEWNFSLQRQDNRIEIQVQSPSTKQIWREVLRSGHIPQFILQIESPAIPAEISWRSGKLTAVKWGAPIRATLQSGEAFVSGGEGDLKIVGQETKISVKDRQGHVRLESYSGRINADSIKGPLDIENFIGETHIQSVEGSTDVKSYKGQITVNKGKGRLDFDIARSALKIVNFTGDMKGNADQGSVHARLLEANQVRIRTEEGPVVLELPNSGAQVHAASADGPVQGPSYLKASQLAGMRVLKGRLRGDHEGSVYVRTDSGAIRIR